MLQGARQTLGALFCLSLFFKEGSEGDLCLTGEMLSAQGTNLKA